MPPVLAKKPVLDKAARKIMKESRETLKELKMLRRVAQLEKAAKAAETASQNGVKEFVRHLDRPTISVAIPSSILENAQSPELRTYLAGQIARAACIFKVDEVVVFDDIGTCEPNEITYQREPGEDKKHEKAPIRRSCLQMARILQYLECPQYLRRFFFPLHKDLQYAGLLNPLDTPHHLRQTDEFPFREGVVTGQPSKLGRGSFVNAGLTKDVMVDRQLEAGLRVTVELLPSKEGSKKQKGRVVSPQTPEATTGRYWGYSVRIASSLSHVFSQTPYPRGYDLTVGTSDKGQSVDALVSSGLPSHHHALIVLGGLAGLEGALEADPIIQVDDPALLFDMYLNTCPSQGSRTIRTEEALLITLASLRPLFQVKSSTSQS